jgi:hypothetical protein
VYPWFCRVLHPEKLAAPNHWCTLPNTDKQAAMPLGVTPE